MLGEGWTDVVVEKCGRVRRRAELDSRLCCVDIHFDFGWRCWVRAMMLCTHWLYLERGPLACLLSLSLNLTAHLTVP